MEDALYSAVEIDERYPRWPHPHLVGHVQPSIGGGLAPSPLMLWWALLLALSSLARYHPAAWVQAIDLDQSVLGGTSARGVGRGGGSGTRTARQTPFGIPHQAAELYTCVSQMEVRHEYRDRSGHDR